MICKKRASGKRKNRLRFRNITIFSPGAVGIVCIFQELSW